MVCWLLTAPAFVIRYPLLECADARHSPARRAAGCSAACPARRRAGSRGRGGPVPPAPPGAEPASRGAHRDLGRGDPARQRPDSAACSGARGGVVRLSLDRGDLWDLRTPEHPRSPTGPTPTIQRSWPRATSGELVRLFDAPSTRSVSDEAPGGPPRARPSTRAAVDGVRPRLRRAVGRASFDGRSGRSSVLQRARDAWRCCGCPAAAPALSPGAGGLGRSLATRPRARGQDGVLRVARAGGGSRPVVRVHVAAPGGGRRHGDRSRIVTSRDAATPAGAGAVARRARPSTRGYDTRSRRRTARGGRRFWARRGSPARPGRRAALQPRAVLLRRGVAARCAADAAAGRVDRRRRHAAAVEGRLPHRPEHADDATGRIQAAGHFDEGRSFLDFMWDLLPALPRVRPRASTARRASSCPASWRWTASRWRGWGQYSPVAGAGRVDRAAVLPALALHDGRPSSSRTRAYPWCRESAEGLQAC